MNINYKCRIIHTYGDTAYFSNFGKFLFLQILKMLRNNVFAYDTKSFKSQPTMW